MTEMIQNKKLLKLSRNVQSGGSNQSEKFDDSLDDFIVSRPLKTERKLTKSSEAARKPHIVSENSTSGECLASEYQLPLQADDSSSNHVLLKTESSNISPYFSEISHNVETLCRKNDSTNKLSGVNTRKNVAKRADKKKIRKKEHADPSDISLAIALSESMQLAGEIDRQEQEEMLLMENLTGVITDLRNEDVKSAELAPVFQKSPSQSIAKGKRRAKGIHKKERSQYVLVLRSQAERERMIAEQAAAILYQAADTLKEEKKSFFYTEPTSKFIKQHQQKENTLWERTALLSHQDSHNYGLENFYVSALTSVLSPPAKKSGYSNILFHLSQLPGRGLTQKDTEASTATQVILEQLAFASEGGFVDEKNSNEDPSFTFTSELVQDWSRMVDNPLMSDLQVKTSDKPLHAHRLVIAVRFPQILDFVAQSSDCKSYELNWTQYSSSASKKVLQFIYTSKYDHDEFIAEEVCHICRRFNLRALSELIPNHEQYSFTSENVDEEDIPRLQEETETTSLLSETITRPKSSPTQVTRQCKHENDKISIQTENTSNPSSDSEIEELSYSVITHIHQTHEDRKELEAMPSQSPTSGNHFCSALVKPSTPKNPSKIPRESLSPDMFEESVISSSHCEGLTDPVLQSSCMVDLTQDSDQDGICSSPNTSCPRLAEVINIHTVSPDEKNDTCLAFHERNRTPFLPSSHEKETEIINHPSTYSHTAAVSFVASPERGSSPNVSSSIQQASLLVSSPKSDSSESNSYSQRFNDKQDNFETSLNEQIFVDLEHVDIAGESPTREILSKSQHYSPVQLLNDSFSDWEHCNDGVNSAPFYSSPSSSSISNQGSPQKEKPSVLSCTRKASTEQNFALMCTNEQSPSFVQLNQNRTVAGSHKSKANETPDLPRPTKKRKIDITPLPNYQAMDTPGLKKELDKYGLKPLNRKNAVKLLHHIYEELHPFVTDTESSFQETPERPFADKPQEREMNNKNHNTRSKSLDRSSQAESDSSLVEDEESMIVSELDKNLGFSPRKTQDPVTLTDQLKNFFQTRRTLYHQVLTYEPIEFEFLYKEVRKDGIRCKAEELLDWLDQQCITCRMKPRDRNRQGKTRTCGEAVVSPKHVHKSQNPVKPQGRRVAKKLIT